MSREEMERFALVTEYVTSSSLGMLPAELADQAIAFGNPESDTVIINTQGGPIPELATDELLEIFASVDLDETLLLNVHQAQTLNP